MSSATPERCGKGGCYRPLHHFGECSTIEASPSHAITNSSEVSRELVDDVAPVHVEPKYIGTSLTVHLRALSEWLADGGDHHGAAIVRDAARRTCGDVAAPVQIEADAWMPIETAPRDGSHVLVSMNPADHYRRPPTVCHWFDGGWHLSVNRDGDKSEFFPKFWATMPSDVSVLRERIAEARTLLDAIDATRPVSAKTLRSLVSVAAPVQIEANADEKRAFAAVAAKHMKPFAPVQHTPKADDMECFARIVIRDGEVQVEPPEAVSGVQQKDVDADLPQDRTSLELLVSRINIGGVFDEFRSVFNAAEQMGHYIRQVSDALAAYVGEDNKERPIDLLWGISELGKRAALRSPASEDTERLDWLEKWLTVPENCVSMNETSDGCELYYWTTDDYGSASKAVANRTTLRAAIDAARGDK